LYQVQNIQINLCGVFFKKKTQQNALLLVHNKQKGRSIAALILAADLIDLIILYYPII
jgi:hypothetical protein